MIRFELPTRMSVDCVNPLGENVQGTKPAKLKSGYGMQSDGIFASLPKNRLKINMVNNG